MTQFRKKPVVVEAFQMTRERRHSNDDWPEWMHEAWNKKREAPGSLFPTEKGKAGGTLSIATLEGQHLVSWDDWIIRGIAGELYPCKPEIFAATYEKVEDIESWEKLKLIKSVHICDWRENDDGNWETECGQMFAFETGTPTDNKMKFCYCCGKPLRSIPQHAKDAK